MKSHLPATYFHTLEMLKQKISSARLKAVLTANVQLLATYWEIGKAIAQQEAEQGWGAKVVEQLAKDLSSEFPDFKGLSSRNLRYMRNFALSWPELSILQRIDTGIELNSILQQAAAKLPWFHICTLLDKVKDPRQRQFYAEQAVENGWSRNVLVHQIEARLFHRKGQLQHNFSNTLSLPQGELVKELFKDPYKFDFFNLSKEAKEKDLEDALVNHILKFLLEMGKGFSFVGKQVLIHAGGKDYYIDLLLYHLKLHCYVALELKVGDFKPEFAGKMNFYLSTLDIQYKTPEDNPTIGLILCKNKNKVTVEYALKDVAKPMGVAAYQLTHSIPKNLRGQLPSIEALEKELKRELPFTKSNRESREQMGILLSKLSPEELKRKKSVQVLADLWTDVIPKLKYAIEAACKSEKELFSFISVHRYIDDTFAELHMAGLSDITINTKEFSLLLKMKNLKAAGSKAFSIEEYLSFQLKPTFYLILHDSKVWYKKKYYEIPDQDEQNEICERLVNVALTKINAKLSEIVRH